MNILFIATYPEITGATNSLIGLVSELKKRGHRPVVLVKCEGYLTQKLKDLNIEYVKHLYLDNTISIKHVKKVKHVVKLSAKVLLNKIANLRMKRILNKYQIEIVHFNAITVDVGYEVFNKAGIPIVWHIREFLEEDHHSTLMTPKISHRKINSSDKIIAISESIEIKYSKVFKKEKIVTIYNGIDPIPFENLKKIDADTIVLGVVGRICPGKGQFESIKAFEMMSKEYPSVILYLIGSISDSEYFKKISDYIKKRKLDGRVFFLGSKTTPQDIWGELDIVIVSSGAEAFGRVTVEAMFASKIIVGANSAGTKELLSFVGSDLLYEQGNPESLSLYLKKAIDEKSKYVDQLKQIKVKAKQYFTAESNAIQIENLYYDINKDFKNM